MFGKGWAGKTIAKGVWIGLLVFNTASFRGSDFFSSGSLFPEKERGLSVLFGAIERNSSHDQKPR